MAIRQIRQEGDEILKKKSREVENIDEKIQILIDDMIDTMHKYNGVGLAAVQVGILKRVLVIDLYDENRTCCNDKSCNIKNKRCRRNGRRMFKLSKSIC